VYKAGDIVPFRVRLLNNAGAPQTYADKTAFLAAGYTVQYDIGGVLASPTWTFNVINSGQGEYDILLTVQEGNGYLTVIEPVGFESWPRTRPVSAEIYNLGSIVALVTSTNGTPINQDRTSVTDFTLVEGDSFLRTVVVPLASLEDWGFSDLTSTTWSLSAAARKRENRLQAQPDFIIAAYITDTVNRIVTLALNPFPTGAEIDAGDATKESQEYLYDLQLRNTLTYAITALNQGAKTFTVAGDRRKLFSLNTAPATTIAITGSTGNNATYTVLGVAYTGGNTVITVSEAIPNATVDGSVNVTIRFTPNKGTVRSGRQEDRT
jgi:hypothetical protein